MNLSPVCSPSASRTGGSVGLISAPLSPMAPVISPFAIIPWLGAVAGNEPAAVEVDQNRESLFAGFCGRPDVQIKAVFAHSIGSEYHVAEDGRLHRPRAKFVGLAHAMPILSRLRSFP